MSDKQQEAILEVCRNLISTGIAFGFQRERTEPEYPAERGLAEIIAIVEPRTLRDAASDPREWGTR